MNKQKLKVVAVGIVVVGLIALAAIISSGISPVAQKLQSDDRSEDLSSIDSHDDHQMNVDHPDVKRLTDQAAKIPALTADEREKFIESSLAKLEAKERVALLSFTEIFDEFVESQQGVETLIADLKARKTAPYLMRDENPYTGTLKVVRTKNTLPGTRYFHAQIFKDEEGLDFVQHMSFEFRPGDASFDGVKAALMKSLGITGSPTMQKDGFISWKKGAYSIWAKRMGLEDFKNNTFNAHEKKDVGTIWVAMELEIHDHEAPIYHAPVSEEASVKE